MPRDPDQFDFFVSYARADNQPAAPGQPGWITAFVDALIEEHRKFSGGRTLTPFFDKDDIRSLDDWQHRLRDGLASSRLFLAFLSPRYFASEWCRREWRTWIDLEIAKHILSSGAAPIYILEVPGFDASPSDEDVARRVAELCSLPAPHNRFLDNAAPVIRQLRQRQFNAVLPFYREGLDALRKADLRGVLERLARDMDERVELSRHAAESANTVPPYNKRFSGRVDELHALRQRLTNDRAGVITGIHGLGGIGKTELAFAYAHAYAGVYRGGRFLVPCEGRTSLRDAVLRLGDFEDFRAQISDEQRMQPETYFEALCGCLRRRIETHGQILLVLDNVTDLALLSHEQTDPLIAVGPQLHLLCTTRLLPPAAEQARWLTLGELPEADAMELLAKHRPFLGPDGQPSDEEWKAARSIARRLDGFALAIELVAAWLRTHPNISYARMAESLGLQDLETLAGDEGAELRRHNHERRLSAVLGPVLESLSPPERRAMEYAALLAPDAVPVAWLKELTVGDFPELDQPTRLSDPWEDLWRRLVHLALLSRPEDNNTTEEAQVPAAPAIHSIHRVHRLVQDLLLSRMLATERKERSQVVVLHVKRHIEALGDSTSLREGIWETAPLESLAQRWDEERHEQAARLLNAVGYRWYALAEWARAEPLMRRALQIHERSDGPNDQNVAISLNNLAVLLQETNRVSEAEPLMRRALEIREKGFGQVHPDVATVLNNLADLLRITNRLAEAESLVRRALDIREKCLGQAHPDVATSLNNLAAVLRETYRLSEVEPLYRRTLEIYEQSYGPEHPLVATALNNLAELKFSTNRLSEAEPLCRRALVIREQSLGQDHPEVAKSLNNLAVLLQERNHPSEAEPLCRKALEICERSYGPTHPQVANALNSLADVLKRTSRFTEAEPLARRALEIREQSFGPDHPDVAGCLIALGDLLVISDRPSEAEPLCRRALGIYERSYGPSHPRVANALDILGIVLKKASRFSEAEPLVRRSLEIREQSFSPDHPDVARSLIALGDLLIGSNRPSEAEPLCRKALEIYERSNGPNHPYLATALSTLAALLRNTNDLSGAEPLMRRAVEILISITRAAGYRHPQLHSAVSAYSGLLQAMGEEQAEIDAHLRTLAPELFEP